MAGSNSPPSSSRQHLEVDNPYDNDWGQAEDDDWPTLISSIEHDPHPGPDQYVDGTFQAEADEAILNGIVSGRSGQSSRHGSQQASQQAAPKVLTRPLSSGKDPAAGFSFTKAKPVQQFDFGRPKQAPVIHQPPDLPRPAEEVRTETRSHQSPPLPDNTQAVNNAVQVTAYHSPSPGHHDAPVFNDSLPVPFPDVMPAQPQAYQKSAPTAIKGPIMLNFSSTNTLPNEGSTATDVSLVNSDPNRTKKPPLLNIVFPNHNKPTTATASTADGSANFARFIDQTQVDKPDRSRKASKDPLTSVAGAPKITKSRRRKTQVDPIPNGSQPPSSLKSTYTEEDLLRLLMYRRRQGQQELEDFKTTQNQREAEILRLREMSSSLSNELHEVLQRETQNAAELSRIKAKKPIWESKIKRLSDYVKGLTNDHKRLREDADSMQKQRTDLLVAGKDVHDTLEGAQQLVKQERIRSQKSEDDNRHKIESLAQTIQHQRTQLQCNEVLIKAERERSDRIEDQMTRATVNHEQLWQFLTCHRDTITSKIDNLLHQAKSIVLPNKAPEPHSQEPVKQMLEQCIGMLQELREADTVKPEDLGKLGNTMDSFVRGITLSVEACEENFNSLDAGQKQLALALQDQLRDLGDTISSEHALSEQISDLREVKATVRERLQVTESSLTDARREIVALRHKDQEQSRRVAALEHDVAKAQSQPAVSPQALLRIQELDSRNKDLQQELVTLSKDAAILSNQFQQISAEAKEVTERLAAAQEALEAAHKEAAKSREEKSASEEQAMVEREQLRKDLSEAANLQLASKKSEHMEALQQLTLEKSAVEEKLKSVAEQVNLLIVEKERAEMGSRTLQALLEEARSEKEAVIGTRKALQLHLKEMEIRMHQKNLEGADMQAILKKANDQVKARDLEITALRASQASRISPSRVAEHTNTLRGAQSTGSRHGLHRGSQQALIDNSPSIRPASSKSSRHFTKRPPLVEDSQPTEKPGFVSLDDLILEDPFADYAHEGPDTIAGEDISHLFPSTPGAGSHTRDVDYSRKSVFHTTVVSETQRRQPQLREATPHAGNHAMIIPQSKSQARAYSRDGQVDAMPRSSVVTSTAKANIPRREASNPDSQGKRNTVAAGFNDTKSQRPPSKLLKAGPAKPVRALGPMIEDSQSPHLNGRSRKMTRRKSSAPKVDKFARRFAQD